MVRVNGFIVLVLAWPWLSAGASQADCDQYENDAVRIICQAPKEARDRLIGRMELTNQSSQFHLDIVAAALLHSEWSLLGPTARAGDTMAQQRREVIHTTMDALERRNRYSRDCNQSFEMQWMVLSGHLQSVDERRLTWPLQKVWREWNVGNNAAMRAQTDARRLVLEAYPHLAQQPGSQPAPPPLPVPRGPPPPPVVIDDLQIRRPPSSGCQAQEPAVSRIDDIAIKALVLAWQMNGAASDRRIEYGGYILRVGDEYRYQTPVPGSANMIKNTDKHVGLIIENYGHPVAGMGGCDFCFRQSDIECVASYHIHPRRKYNHLH